MTANRLPRNAREILARAVELGHVPSIEQTPRGLWRFHCSCGYSSTNRQTRALASSTLSWHLGKAIGQAYDTTNGTEARRHPAGAPAPMRAAAPRAAGMESA